MWISIILGGAVILIVLAFVALKGNPIPKIQYIVSGIIAFIAVILSFNSLVVVDAGEIGAVIVFGKVQKGIIQSGMHSVNPFAKIVIYPSRLREFSAQGTNSVAVRSGDGLNVNIEISILYSVVPKKVAYIYKNVARNISDLENRIFKPIVRTGIRDMVAKYSANEIYSSKRQEIGNKIKERIIAQLEPKGISIDSVMIRKIALPNSVDEAIQAKLAAEQQSQAMDFKKVQAKKEADIQIITAKGQAAAQKIINSTLTTNFLQHKAIEAYTKLAKSKNTTFIIMPTSPKGTGMPLILNGK